YAETCADPAAVARIVALLRPLHPAERIEDWLRRVDAADWAGLAGGLIRDHYDPRYEKHRARHEDGRWPVVALDGLDDLDGAASAVEAALAGQDLERPATAARLAASGGDI
ncbi:tRNA 2-selenouridine(34) synthase MnmH, partial [Paracoccus thiocyanatus]